MTHLVQQSAHHISSQLLGMTADNASNNDTLMHNLAQISKRWARSWREEQGHARCFAHILNLVAQSLLRQFDAPARDKGNGGNARKKGATAKGKEVVRGEGDGRERGGGVPDAANSSNEPTADEDLAEQLVALGDDQETDSFAQPDAREGDDNLEGWRDELAEMHPNAADSARRDAAPARLLLAKVRGSFRDSIWMGGDGNTRSVATLLMGATLARGS